MCQVIGDKTGRRPRRFVMSDTAFAHMMASDSLRVLIRGDLAPSAPLQQAEVQNLFTIYDLPTIIRENATVNNEAADGTVSTERLLRVDRAFLLPDVNVGETLWGPTAESRALLGTPAASQAPGIIAVTYGTAEPPAEWIKAAATAFPTMPDAHLLGQVELF
jgi:hypothetical protein